MAGEASPRAASADAPVPGVTLDGRPVRPPPGFEAILATGLGFGPAPPAPTAADFADGDPSVVAAGPVVPPTSPISSKSTWSGGIGPGGKCCVTHPVVFPCLVPFVRSFCGVCCGSKSLSVDGTRLRSLVFACFCYSCSAVFHCLLRRRAHGLLLLFVGARITRLAQSCMPLVYRRVHSSKVLPV